MEVFLLKASRNITTLLMIYHLKKRKDERYIKKKIVFLVETIFIVNILLRSEFITDFFG